MGSNNTASVQMQGEASGYAGPREWPGLAGRSSSGWEVRYEWAARGKEIGVEVGGAGWPAGPRGLSPSPQA